MNLRALCSSRKISTVTRASCDLLRNKTNNANWTNTAHGLREQWSNPGKILRLLLLIDGDTV